MNFVVDDLIVISPNRDSPVGPALDLESIDNIVTAVQINPLVTVREVLPIDDGPAFDLGSEHDRTGRTSVGAQVQSPTTAVVGICSGHDCDRHAGTGQLIRPGYRPEWLRRRSGVRIISLRRHIEISPISTDNSQGYKHET